MQAYEEFLKDIFEEINIEDLGLLNSDIKEIKENILNGERSKLQDILPRKKINNFLIQYLKVINKQEKYTYINKNPISGKETCINLIGNYTESTIASIYIKTLILVPYYYMDEGCLFPIKEERSEWLSFNNELKEFLEKNLSFLILLGDKVIDDELKEYLFLNSNKVRSSAVYLYLTTLIVSKIFNDENIKNDFSNVDLRELLKAVSFKEEEELIKDMFDKLKKMNDLNNYMTYETFLESDLTKEIKKLSIIANQIEDIDFFNEDYKSIDTVIPIGDYLKWEIINKKEEILSIVLGIEGSLLDINNVFKINQVNNIEKNNEEKMNETEYVFQIDIEKFNKMLLSKYLLNNIVDSENFFRNMFNVSFIQINDFDNHYGYYTIKIKYINNNSRITFNDLFENFKVRLNSILVERRNFEVRINKELSVSWDSFFKEKVLREKIEKNENIHNIGNNDMNTNRRKI